ncbi:MAG: diguanylate cyclase [Aliarcobacter sp.]
MGDAVLKVLQESPKNLTRKEDVIARYGGEEFIALINYQDEIEVERYVKKGKKALSNSNFIYKEANIKLKFSAGVTYRNKYNLFKKLKKEQMNFLRSQT